MSDMILSLAEIDAILAEPRRTRGEYKPVVDNFADSGEIAMDLTARFPGKTAASLKQSVNVNIEKHGVKENWPAFKLLITGKDDESTGEKATLLLVNLDAHAAATAAAKAAEVDESDENDDE